MEEEHTTCIKHDDDKRLDNIDFSTLDAFLAKGSIQKESKKAKKRVSEQLHQQIGKKKLKKGEYIANRSRAWGVANLIKNFIEETSI
jgi:hypothetical protein